MVRLGAIRASAGDVAVGQLVELPLAIAATRDLMRPAWQLRDVVTPYDACYAALAEALEATFVTADRPLARALAARSTRAVFLGDLSGPSRDADQVGHAADLRDRCGGRERRRQSGRGSPIVSSRHDG